MPKRARGDSGGGKAGKGGGKGGDKGGSKSSGKGRGQQPGKSGGGASGNDAKIGGKSGGKAARASDGLTRKQRAKAATAGGKGKAGGVAWGSAKKPSVATGATSELGGKKKKRYKRLGNKKTPTVPEMPPPICRNGHKMESRSDNPKGYTNQACCDVCASENMPKKLDSFFHCSFCRFDLCPRCATTWNPEKDAKQEKGDDDEPKKKVKGKRANGKAQAQNGEVAFSRARREIWLPSEVEAVSRAPLKEAVVTDFVEGVPL